MANKATLCEGSVFGGMISRKLKPAFVNLGGRNPNFTDGSEDYQARALRVLGLLLADGAPTVGRGKTF